MAAYAAWFPAGTVFLCVVDPGVGGARPAIILEADGKWYVGPGNGLFELVQRRAERTHSFDITWHPERSRVIVWARRSTVRIRCQHQGSSLVTPMGDEIYYRYQQSLIDEAMTTLATLFQRAPSAPNVHRAWHLHRLIDDE